MERNSKQTHSKGAAGRAHNITHAPVGLVHAELEQAVGLVRVVVEQELLREARRVGVAAIRTQTKTVSGSECAGKPERCKHQQKCGNRASQARSASGARARFPRERLTAGAKLAKGRSRVAKGAEPLTGALPSCRGRSATAECSPTPSANSIQSTQGTGNQHRPSGRSGHDRVRTSTGASIVGAAGKRESSGKQKHGKMRDNRGGLTSKRPTAGSPFDVMSSFTRRLHDARK